MVLKKVPLHVRIARRPVPCKPRIRFAGAVEHYPMAVLVPGSSETGGSRCWKSMPPFIVRRLAQRWPTRCALVNSHYACAMWWPPAPC